jgi:hypothetical protein
MSWTLAKIVDQVYLAVTGGIPSDDINVERADIKNLATAAINEAAEQHVRMQLNDAIQERREFGIGRGSIAEDLLLNYTLDIKEDTTRSLDYVLLPSSEMYLSGNAGLRQAYIPGGDTDVSFRRVENASHLKGLPDLTGVIWMWVEKLTGESRVYFRGLGLPKPEQIMVRAALSIGSIGDNDELPITGVVALNAIKTLTAFFAGQREVPEDMKNDGVDEKV